MNDSLSGKDWTYIKSQKSLFNCHYCTKIFSSQSNHSTHTNKGHIDKDVSSQHSCEYCKKMFKNDSNLKIHIKIYHPASECKPTKIAESSFKNIKTNIVEKQSKVTNNIENASAEHERNKPSTKGACDNEDNIQTICFNCPRCKKSFQSKRGMKTHITTVHLKQSYKSVTGNDICNHCGKKNYLRKGP